MFVETDGFFVIRLDFATQELTSAVILNEARRSEGYPLNRQTKIFNKVKKQVSEYFEGERKRFDLPIKLDGTDFQKKVWKALLTIPYGKTACYDDIAKRIKMPKAVRAVASAIGKNPVAIFYPCHRVIRKNGQIGKYAGGVKMKIKLLKLERVISG